MPPGRLIAADQRRPTGGTRPPHRLDTSLPLLLDNRDLLRPPVDKHPKCSVVHNLSTDHVLEGVAHKFAEDVLVQVLQPERIDTAHTACVFAELREE